MESAYDNKWICQMAERLTCEIMECMAGIKLQRCLALDDGAEGETMDAIYGVLGDDNEMQVRFRAESRLFARMAGNMIGGEPESREEIQEYAAEFFNVLCGRFISELHETIHTPVQFFSIQYKLVDAAVHERGGEVGAICFISEKEEFAEFSWTAMLIEKLLRRNTNVNA